MVKIEKLVFPQWGGRQRFNQFNAGGQKVSIGVVKAVCHQKNLMSPIYHDSANIINVSADSSAGYKSEFARYVNYPHNI